MAKETVKEERDRAQRYLDIAEVILVAINANQKVGLINKKGCSILGYSEKEIIGKNWFDNFLQERMKNAENGSLVMVVDDDPNTLQTFRDVLEGTPLIHRPRRQGGPQIGREKKT